MTLSDRSAKGILASFPFEVRDVHGRYLIVKVILRRTGDGQHLDAKGEPVRYLQGHQDALRKGEMPSHGQVLLHLQDEDDIRFP